MIGRIALIVAAALCAGPAAAATFGLVVGANDYLAENHLDGAVDDAKDIAQALKKYGAQDIITLFDREVTKAAVVQGYDKLLAEAKSGDTLVFSYAGHGSQAPERIKGSEADGLDEFFLLPGFDRSRPETMGEIVLDDEIHAWMERANEKGVKVILVADSCHSGGMMRAVNVKYRFAPAVKVPVGLDSEDAAKGANITEDQLPNAMFFSASLESQLTPELHIDGASRGALSYAFSRALEGKADDNKDGKVSKAELESYVVATVENYAEMLQTPVIRPRDAGLSDDTVFQLGQAPAAPSPNTNGSNNPAPSSNQNPNKPNPPNNPVAAADVAVPDVPFSVVNGPSIKLDGVSPGNGSSYRWNAVTKQFLSPLGDIVGTCIQPGQLQQVVDKFRVVEMLRHEAVSRTGTISIEPSKPLYVAHDQIALAAPQWPEPSAVVFDLANTGEVQFMGESKGNQTGGINIGNTSVIEPYGADHLVVMSLKTKTSNLAIFLKGRPAPTTTQLLGLLPLLLKGQDARIAVQSLYTAAAPQRSNAAGQLQAQEAASCP